MRHFLWTAGVTCAILLASSPRVSAQTLDPSFQADIRTLMDVTGAGAMGVQMATMVANSTIDSMRKSQPNVPERAVAIVKDVLTTEFSRAFGPDGPIQPQMVAIYARHFTHDDVKGLLAFYATDLGKKAVTTMPLLAQEGAIVGQQWAAESMSRVVGLLQERLRAEGF